MARYKLMNVQIRKVGERIDAQGNKTIDPSINPDGKRRFLTASLIPTGGVWGASMGSLPPVFEEGLIQLYEPYLSTANGGSAQTDQPLPDDLAYLNGAWAEWTAPAPFYKKYLVGVAARKPTPLLPQGRPAYPAGHKVMNADGSSPVIYTSISVFTIFYQDEDTGKLEYRKGCTVNELGTAQFQNYCEFVQPQGIEKTPMVEDDVTGGQQPIFTQQPQQPVQQQVQQQAPAFTQQPQQQGAMMP